MDSMIDISLEQKSHKYAVSYTQRTVGQMSHQRVIGEESNKDVIGEGTNKVVGQASNKDVAGEGSNKVVGQASRLSVRSWKRHLPHYEQTGQYYFITFSTYKRRILSEVQKRFIFDAIKFLDGEKYELIACAVLNDHVHLIINPSISISSIMHSIKSFTAHKINQMFHVIGKFWQEENYDRVIRSEKEFLEKLKYIANNPLKAKLAEEYEDYEWLYLKDWIEK